MPPSSVHQYPSSQPPKHFNHTTTLRTLDEAMSTPRKSSQYSQQCHCSSTNTSHTESCSHGTQQTSSPISYSPETSPTSSRRLRGWARSTLAQGPNRPIFDMYSVEQPEADQNVSHKEVQRSIQENIRPSSAPTNSSSQRDQSLFGSANTAGIAGNNWNHRRSITASRDEQFRLDRIKATVDSEQAEAMLLKQEIKTKDFQIDVDKLSTERLSKEELSMRYAAQRRLAESYKRGKGI